MLESTPTSRLPLRGSKYWIGFIVGSLGEGFTESQGEEKFPTHGQEDNLGDSQHAACHPSVFEITRKIEGFVMRTVPP